jgi:hypothetical protein
MKKVLLISKYNWDAPAEIPFVFASAGYVVDVFCPAQSWISCNSYINNCISCSRDESLFLRQLTDLVSKSDYDWIMLTEDPLIELIKREITNEQILQRLLPVQNNEARSILSSKIGFSSYFQSIGIETPAFIGFHNGNDDVALLQTLRFPVIHKYDLSWGGTDMAVSHSLIELQERLGVLEENSNLLIQEFIQGEEIRIDALFHSGKLLNYFCAKVLDHTKSQFSYTTRRSYYSYPELSSLLSLIGEKIKAHGFANISFIRQNETNKHYLIEIDLRPNSWMAYSCYLSNHDFIYCLKYIQEPDKFNYIQSSLKSKNTIELGLFYKDIRRAIWSKDVKGIARWIFGINGYWKFLPFYDFKLTKKVFKEIWLEIGVFKINKLRKKFGLK